MSADALGTPFTRRDHGLSSLRPATPVTPTPGGTSPDTAVRYCGDHHPGRDPAHVPADEFLHHRLEFLAGELKGSHDPSGVVFTCWPRCPGRNANTSGTIGGASVIDDAIAPWPRRDQYDQEPAGMAEPGDRASSPFVWLASATGQAHAHTIQRLAIKLRSVIPPDSPS